MKVLSGLDRFFDEYLPRLKGRAVAILCHQASINREYEHILDLALEHHQRGDFRLKAVFGPQHGLYGQTQDNMIEWEGGSAIALNIPLYSLYGKHRKPTPQMLADIDVLLIDLQDVGARYYTFIWTMALCLEAAMETGVEVWVLDRPNPISGVIGEGNILRDGYESFVGLRPILQRHGLTIGEVALYLRANHYPDVALQVIPMRGWKREMFYEDTGLPWMLPSPNMPTPQTALVYPGQCLLEATNISEGRGTTRPFEIFGAPFLDAGKLCRHLNAQSLPGVVFQPLHFIPTFHKFHGETCQGAFIHVMDRKQFRPVLTTFKILEYIFGNYPEDFHWKNPPYEYEYTLLPIDILCGSDRFRRVLETGDPVEGYWEECENDTEKFLKSSSEYFLY